MKKAEIAALLFAAMGIYSYMKGNSTTSTSSLLQTWLPLGAAAYMWLA